MRLKKILSSESKLRENSMPQGKGTYGSRVGRPTNRLANLKNNPVVKAAIQRDKDIKTTQRSAKIIGGGLSLLIPGGFFAGIGRKAIRQAFRRAGTSGLNLKSADTVGSRIKQAQAIMGLSKNKISLLSGAKVKSFKSAPYWLERGAKLGQGGGKTSIFAMGKTARTIQKAVEQGPAKFFSKGRHPKTGVTAGKRKAQRFHPMDQEDMFGMSNSTSLFHNKDLIRETLKANRLARKKLKKK